MAALSNEDSNHVAVLSDEDNNGKTRDFDYNRAIVAKTAVTKLSVIELTAKVNPTGGEAD